jgi:hypothetical protein
MSKKTIEKKPSVDLSRAEKILLVMYALCDGKRKNLRFEDIVVRAFNDYPDDFHLRGYTEYPDSGDLVHKPLYDFRKDGFVEANNKFFSLTPRGLAVAEKLNNALGGREIKKEGRLSGFADREILRIEKLEGLRLFINGEFDKILDTDFFAYLGVTVRTQKNDFLGRLNTIRGSIDELRGLENQSILRIKISEFHDFMMKKFENIITQKSQ